MSIDIPIWNVCPTPTFRYQTEYQTFTSLQAASILILFLDILAFRIFP